MLRQLIIAVILAYTSSLVEGNWRPILSETLTEAVQCTDDQEGAHSVEQAGHSWYGARTFLGGVPGSVKNPYKPLMVNSEEKCHNGAIKETCTEKGKLKLCGGVSLSVKLDVEARLFSDTEKE